MVERNGVLALFGSKIRAICLRRRGSSLEIILPNDFNGESIILSSRRATELANKLNQEVKRIEEINGRWATNAQRKWGIKTK